LDIVVGKILSIEKVHGRRRRIGNVQLRCIEEDRCRRKIVQKKKTMHR
jgi:hypothetical protein